MVESRGRSCRQDGASGPARCWSFCLEGEPGAEDRMGFHGCKMFSGLPEDNEVVRLERRAGASFRMDPQDQQEAGGFGLKERQEHLSG